MADLQVVKEATIVGDHGVLFAIRDQGHIVARACLYILRNDLHKAPFGFLEDVFVEESHRSQGLGKQIVRAVIGEAKRLGCYKLIATSREARANVHEFYKDLGFLQWGLEFRLDFEVQE